MQFYFAGSFKRQEELRADIVRLEVAGHQCTSRWLSGDHEVDVTTDDDLSPQGPAYKFALEDIEDILNSDAIVFYSSADHDAKGRGGRHSEFGIAWALDKPIFLIGRRENAFHSLAPDVCKFHDFHSFIIALSPTAHQGGAAFSLIEALIEEQRDNPRIIRRFVRDQLSTEQ